MSREFLFSTDMALIIIAFLASGLVRGFTGGAGANFLSAPVLAAIIGPREAVPIILLLNGVTNFQLLTGAVQHVRWREILPIGIAAAVTLPLGAWALFAVDEDLMRRAVAGAAILFALVLISGWRYRGRHGIGVSVAAGSAAGALAGSVSLGGPPVFLYLMSGPDNAATNRAHFVIFAVVLQIVAIAVFFAADAFSARMLWISLIVLVPFSLATWVGTKLFYVTSEQVFRRASLWGMVAVSLAILVL